MGWMVVMDADGTSGDDVPSAAADFAARSPGRQAGTASKARVAAMASASSAPLTSKCRVK